MQQPQPVQPEDRTPAQIEDDLAALRQIRAATQARWGGIVGGHDAHLDTLNYGAGFDPAEAGGVFDGFSVISDADPGL